MKCFFGVSMLFVLFHSSFCQPISDSNDIALGFTDYSFFYNTKFKKSTTTFGPSFSVNTNDKLTVQLGILYDFRRYVFYEKRLDNNGIFYYAPVEHINILIPLLLYYNLIRERDYKLFMATGFLYGGQNILNESNQAAKTGNVNFIAGAGVSCRFLKHLTLDFCPSIRYNSKIFSPGLSLNLLMPFNSRKCL